MQKFEILVYFDENDKERYQSFLLEEGENVIGKNPMNCQVILNFQDIVKDRHAKIFLEQEEDEFALESLSSDDNFGVWKKKEDGSFQKLKTSRMYELKNGQEFYISQKLRCIFRQAQDMTQMSSKKNSVVPSRIKSHTNNTNITQQQQQPQEQNKNQLQPPVAAKKTFKKNQNVNTQQMQSKTKQLSSSGGQLDNSKMEQENENGENSPSVNKGSKKGLGKPFKAPGLKKSATEEQVDKKDKELKKKPATKKQLNTSKNLEKSIEEKEDKLKSKKQQNQSKNNKDKEKKKRNVTSDQEMDLEDDIFGEKEPTTKKQKKETKKEPKIQDNKLEEEKQINNQDQFENSVDEQQEQLELKEESESESEMQQLSKKTEKQLKIKNDKKNNNKTKKDPKNIQQQLQSKAAKKAQEKEKNKKEKGKKQPKQIKEQPSDLEGSDSDMELEISGSSDIEKKDMPKRQSGIKKYTVIFSTCVPTNDQIKKLNKIGIQVVDDVRKDFNIVVMSEYRRRLKLLCGLNKGAHVVKESWIDDCLNEKKALDIQSYIFKPSKDFQTKYKFKLADQKKNIGSGLFEDYKFYVPKDEYFKTITIEEIYDLVETGEGEMLETAPSSPDEFENSEKIIILLNPENKKEISKYIKKGFNCSDIEILFTSCLRQKVDLEEFVY